MSETFLVTPCCPCLARLGGKILLIVLFHWALAESDSEGLHRWNQQAVESLIAFKNNISLSTSSNMLCCYCVFAALINSFINCKCQYPVLALDLLALILSLAAFSSLIKNLCGHNYYEWWYSGEISQICFTTYWTLSFSFARYSLQVKEIVSKVTFNYNVTLLQGVWFK